METGRLFLEKGLTCIMSGELRIMMWFCKVFVTDREYSQK